MKRSLLLLILLPLSLLTAVCTAALSLPATYGDGMVLRRFRPIQFHGTAAAGETVSVTFLGATHSTYADANGRWCVPIPAQPAGGPYELVINSATERRVIKDVWIGEVWLCSGQSNMQLPVASTASAKEDLAAAGTLSRVHIYNVQPRYIPYAVEWTTARLDSLKRGLYFRPAHWERSSRAAVKGFSSIAFNFARELADSLGCHVGVICNAVDGSGCECWIDSATLAREFPEILTDWTNNEFVMGWSRRRAKLNCRRQPAAVQHHPYAPAYLFTAGMQPLEGTDLSGVLWYQGESNADLPDVHHRLFALLEQSWRAFFKNDSLPFYTAQLSSYEPRPSWPRFRDAQRRLADSLSHTHLIVTHDLGERKNIHPRRKREVAHRFVLSALHHTYDRRALCPSGPAYAGFTVEGSRLRLTFRYADGLRPATGNAITGFELAGSDGTFHAARATVVVSTTHDGCDLLVESKAVPRPTAVRYAYQPFAIANLVNAAGLPASTFFVSTK